MVDFLGNLSGRQGSIFGALGDMSRRAQYNRAIEGLGLSDAHRDLLQALGPQQGGPAALNFLNTRRRQQDTSAGQKEFDNLFRQWIGVSPSSAFTGAQPSSGPGRLPPPGGQDMLGGSPGGGFLGMTRPASPFPSALSPQGALGGPQAPAPRVAGGVDPHLLQMLGHPNVPPNLAKIFMHQAKQQSQRPPRLKPPEGYAYVRDIAGTPVRDDQGQLQMYAIPGGPAAKPAPLPALPDLPSGYAYERDAAGAPIRNEQGRLQMYAIPGGPGEMKAAPQAGLPKIPPGYAFTRDAEGAPVRDDMGQLQMYAIPGGPAEMKAAGQAAQRAVPQTAIAKPPPGYAYIRDDEGAPMRDDQGQLQMYAVPGGPGALKEAEAARKIKLGEEKKAQRAQIAQRTTSIMFRDLERSIAALKDERNTFLRSPTLRLGAQYKPGSKSWDTAEAIETIRKLTSLDKLQEMRNSSPTGGALGVVTDRDVALLKDALGNLGFGQSTERLIENLEYAQKLLIRTIHGPGVVSIGNGFFVREKK